MQRRDEEFLSKKLSELKREVRGIKALDLSSSLGQQSLQGSEAARRAGEPERVVRYSMSKGAPQNVYSMRNASSNRPEPGFGEDYRVRSAADLHSRLPGHAAAGATPGRATPVSAVFEQIYRKMDGGGPSPLHGSGGTPMSTEQFYGGGEAADKHEMNLVHDLSQKLSLEVNSNQRLNSEIGSLRKTLEAERLKTAAGEEQLRAELREAKTRENESLSELSALERKSQEVAQRTRTEEDRIAHHRNELEELRRDNELLRSELKRLGDLTGEKIIELENGLNSIARMREFEHSNFEMEKNNIVNTGEFVMEQMRVKFMERGLKLEEQVRLAGGEREKIAAESRELLDELRGFNAAADARIGAIVTAVRDEQKAKNDAEMAEINNRIRLEEDELAHAQQRHKDLLVRFQNVEREGKSRLIARKNENMRAKEELSSADQQYNKLLVMLNGENKDLEKKAAAVVKLEAENRDIREKTEQIERRFAEELQRIQADHAADVHDLETQLAAAVADEQSLARSKQEANARIAEFQKKHSELIRELETNLSSTLNHHFAGESPGGRPSPKPSALDTY